MFVCDKWENEKTSLRIFALRVSLKLICFYEFARDVWAFDIFSIGQADPRSKLCSEKKSAIAGTIGQIEREREGVPRNKARIDRVSWTEKIKTFPKLYNEGSQIGR